MNIQDLLNSATWIVARPGTQYCAGVSHGTVLHAPWLTYVTRATPLDADSDECELSIGELIAEYPGIDIAETSCLVAGAFAPGASDYIVFSR